MAKSLNTKRWAILQKIHSEIFAAGDSAVPELIDAYDKVRFWQGRKLILYSLVRYGRTHKEAYELGIKALKDESSQVREEANVLIATADSNKAIERFKAGGETCPEWPFNVKE